MLFEENMDGIIDHHIKDIKPDIERQTLHAFLMWNLSFMEARVEPCPPRPPPHTSTCDMKLERDLFGEEKERLLGS